MRTGRNPAKSGLEAYTPKELGVALILYIPSQDGYFANVLDIFKMQIASLKAPPPNLTIYWSSTMGAAPRLSRHCKSFIGPERSPGWFYPGII